ncbi:MAG: hypothetical protein QM767_13390 [Anaeromyxobacter sp.]
MPPATSTSRRARARGQVSWVTLLILGVLVGGGYLGVVWIPVYLVHATVKQTVHMYMNEAVKNTNDAELVRNMTHKLRVLAEEEVVGEDGGVELVPAVDVSPEDVTWEADRESEHRTLHVAFEYTRQVKYPLLDKVTEKTFSIDMTENIDVPDWGPAR